MWTCQKKKRKKKKKEFIESNLNIVIDIKNNVRNILVKSHAHGHSHVRGSGPSKDIIIIIFE
jgi:hypothetical protein